MSSTFALLVPVKTLTLAKSRLDVTGPAGREPLMRAFALDAVTAASQASSVGRVYVVTEEPGFGVRGAVRLPDEGDGDLNRALHHASLRLRRLDPTLRVAAMCADLPCLVAAQLDAALGAGTDGRWFVADADGTGTTLLAAGRGVDLDPRFGPGSARLHEDSGATPVLADLPTLRMDVDTEADLKRATGLGVGPHTAELLDAHPAPRHLARGGGEH